MDLMATLTAASCLGLILLVLAIRCVSARTQQQKAERAGEDSAGADAALAHRMRVMANFLEYTPFLLILLAALETTTLPLWMVYTLAAMQVLGRGLHAWGYSRSTGESFGRMAGTLLTWAVLLLGSILGLYAAILL